MRWGFGAHPDMINPPPGAGAAESERIVGVRRAAVAPLSVRPGRSTLDPRSSCFGGSPLRPPGNGVGIYYSKP